MRTAIIERNTKETQIKVCLNLDNAEDKGNINTGIGFFDHMLTALSVHSEIGLSVQCEGDTYVDCHHTIEDVGIVIGMAFAKALGDKMGIARYGSAYIPMDEALAFSVIDISQRPYLVFEGEFSGDKIGEMDTQMVEEFFRAFAVWAGVTLHVRILYGKNDHHKAEAAFKAFAHAVKRAIRPLNASAVLTTKGVL
jgi:Imidazoleglycerol-phosphate dehydratase